METIEVVYAAIKNAGEPVNAGKIAEITGVDRKEVDKAFKKLKDTGRIVSPKRCFWTAAE
ncbi:MAG: HTH domain-containing protein [Bacteroidales bacterium]